MTKITHDTLFPSHETIHAGGRFLTFYCGLFCYEYEGRFVATNKRRLVVNAQTESDLYDALEYRS